MPQRKTILWVSHFLPFPVKSGAQIRSFNLMKQLASYHDVSLFCVVQESVVLNYFSSVQEAIDKALPVFAEFCESVNFYVIKKDSRYEKAKDLIYSLFYNRSYSAQRIYSKELKEKLRFEIDRIGPESIHLDTVALGVFTDLFKEVRVILNHHNIESIMMARRAKESKGIVLSAICFFDSLKIRSLEKKISSYAVRHLVCSELDKERLNGIFPNSDIMVVPNGIDCSKSAYERTPFGHRLLFIGGLDWYPNADAIRFFLKSIWPLLSKEFPELYFDIVGKCPPADIVSLCHEEKNVMLHGFVNDISGFYKSGWIYVCPIMDGGGTKLKVLDAMANGIPLIAHPVAMEGIEADPGVHYFCAITAQDYIDVIKKISCSERAMIANVEIAARNLIFEKYNYDTIGKILSNAY